MKPLEPRLLPVVANLATLLSRSRGVASKVRLCRWIAASALFRSLPRALSASDAHTRQTFIRFKDANVWFGSAPGTHELSPYVEIFVRKEYDDEHLRMHDGEVILDVGANIGLFALRCAQRYPGVPVFSFEPHPDAYHRLVMNLEANGADCVTPINAAVSSAPGRVPLFAGAATVSASLVAAGRPSFSVRAVTLDDFCRDHSLASIGLLKVDVEGAELKVLQGARETLPITKCLMVECHSPALENSVRTMLEFAGFDSRLKRDTVHGARVLEFIRTRPESNSQLI